MSLNENNIASLTALTQSQPMLDGVNNADNPFLKKLQAAYQPEEDCDRSDAMKVFLTGLKGAVSQQDLLSDDSDNKGVKGYLKSCDNTGSAGLKSAIALLDEAEQYQKTDSIDKKKEAIIEHRTPPKTVHAAHPLVARGGAVAGMAAGALFAIGAYVLANSEADLANDIRDEATIFCHDTYAYRGAEAVSDCVDDEYDKAVRKENTGEVVKYMGAVLGGGVVVASAVSLMSRVYGECKERKDAEAIKATVSALTDSQVNEAYNNVMTDKVNDIAGNSLARSLADVQPETSSFCGRFMSCAGRGTGFVQRVIRSCRSTSVVEDDIEAAASESPTHSDRAGGVRI